MESTKKAGAEQFLGYSTPTIDKEPKKAGAEQFLGYSTPTIDKEPDYSTPTIDKEPLKKSKKNTQLSVYFFTWCLFAESNHGHRDFQSLALPTELNRHISNFSIK